MVKVKLHQETESSLLALATAPCQWHAHSIGRYRDYPVLTNGPSLLGMLMCSWTYLDDILLQYCHMNYRASLSLEMYVYSIKSILLILCTLVRIATWYFVLYLCRYAGCLVLNMSLFLDEKHKVNTNRNWGEKLRGKQPLGSAQLCCLITQHTQKCNYIKLDPSSAVWSPVNNYYSLSQ